MANINTQPETQPIVLGSPYSKMNAPDPVKSTEEARQALMQQGKLQQGQSVSSWFEKQVTGGGNSGKAFPVTDEDWNNLTVDELLNMSGDPAWERGLAHLTIKGQQTVGKLMVQMTMTERLSFLSNLPVEQQEAVMKEMGPEEQKATYEKMSFEEQTNLLRYERSMDMMHQLDTQNSQTLAVLKGSVAERYSS